MRGSDKLSGRNVRTTDAIGMGQAVRAATGVQNLVERHVDDLDAQSARILSLMCLFFSMAITLLLPMH